jgi:hypothetical protein
MSTEPQSTGRATRKIWFWQAWEFRENGWATIQEGATVNPKSWLPALAEAIRPTVIKLNGVSNER